MIKSKFTHMPLLSVKSLSIRVKNVVRKAVVECVAPGCGRWFRNRSGYTKHYNTYHREKVVDDACIMDEFNGADSSYIPKRCLRR